MIREGSYIENIVLETLIENQKYKRMHRLWIRELVAKKLNMKEDLPSFKSAFSTTIQIMDKKGLIARSTYLPPLPDPKRKQMGIEVQITPYGREYYFNNHKP